MDNHEDNSNSDNINQDDNQPRAHHVFAARFQIGATLQNVLRGLNNAFHQMENPDTRDDEMAMNADDLDDLPPLEPLIRAPSSSASTPPTTQASSSAASTSVEDIDMPLATPSSRPTSPQIGQRVDQGQGSEDDDDDPSMPELRSVSDTSSGESNDDEPVRAPPWHLHRIDVHSRPASHPPPLIDDDRDTISTDVDDDLPSLERMTGSRRARVEDDVDEARDRRHPSERVGNASATDNAHATANPQPQAQPQQQQQQRDQRVPPRNPLNTAFFGGPLNPNAFGFGEDHTVEQTGEANAHPPSSRPDGRPHSVPPLGTPPSNPASVPNPNADGHRPRRGLALGFSFTIPVFGTMPMPGAAGAGAQNTEGNSNNDNDAGGGQGAAPADANANGDGNPNRGAGDPPWFFPFGGAPSREAFAAFLQDWQNLQFDEPPEDPERAKKLLAGLDVVPIGLVKRLERVGGAPGGHVDGSSLVAENLPPGCAVCWDSLLNAEGAGFGEKKTEESEDGDGDEDDDAPSEEQQDTPTSDNLIPEEPRIIALPCAHIFHESCLLPWFTRSKLATCPTCRFNIDPENLTFTVPPRGPFNWVPPPFPPPHPANAGAPAAGPGAQPADTQQQPQPQPDQPQPQPPAPGAQLPGAGQAGPRPTGPAGPGLNPFPTMPNVHIFPFHPFLGPRPGGNSPAPAPGAAGAGPNTDNSPPSDGQRSRAQSLPNMNDNNNHPFGNLPPGMPLDIVTIGLDMIVHGPPPPAFHPNPLDPGGDNHEDDDADDGPDVGPDAEGDGTPGDNQGFEGLSQEMRQLVDGLLRSTANMMAAAGGQPPPANGAPPPQAQAAGTGAPQPPPGPQAQVPHAQADAGQGGAQPRQPRAHFFRPMRPMPSRRERKEWMLPPPPGPSLRQRIEQKEREQGLRCFDMSCGVGPSDDDPYPVLSPGSMKQLSIHSRGVKEGDDASSGAVCAHTFHPACLVSAERVAWGGANAAAGGDEDGEDATRGLDVEVSCSVCRAVGHVKRSEWEEGVAAL